MEQGQENGILLKDFGVDEFKNKLYKALSTGQKRRLHLAIALINSPDIIILDEPTAGLDVEGTVLGLFVRSTSRLTMVSQLIFLPSLMLSGIMFPAELLPEVFQKAGYLFPATWGLKLFTASHWEVLAFVPMVIYLVLAVYISSYRLSKLGLD